MLNRCANYGGEGLWIRKAYKKGFEEKEITAVIRPRDRSDPNDKNHIRAGVPLPVRFIESPEGTSAIGEPGKLLPDDGTTVERTDVVVKKIRDLTENDLRGGAPDYSTPELARYHLALTYNTELPSLDDTVTVWHFKYLPNATT